jgi:flagellar basal body-associated protein FliL
MAKIRPNGSELKIMKKAIILTVVILAVGAIAAYKFIGGNQSTAEQKNAPAASTPAANQTDAQNKTTFYLFHDPSDQDAGCRRIYAFADQPEKELAARVEVKRPDVKTEKAIVDKFQVRVLPTILLVSPDGQITERFEGEDGDTIKKLESLMTRLKTAE